MASVLPWALAGRFDDLIATVALASPAGVLEP